MVLFAIALHFAWALILFIDDSALGATAIHALYRWIPMPWLMLVIVGAAMLALISIVSKPPWFVILLLPQQVLLVMSAAGAVEAIWLAQFADGVVRPRAFLAADQFYSILACIGHTVAIIAHTGRVTR